MKDILEFMNENPFLTFLIVFFSCGAVVECVKQITEIWK